MKLHRHALAAFAALTLAFTSAASAQTIVGTGNDSSFLILEADAFGAPLKFELRYDYNSASPLDAYDLLTAIDLASPELTFSFQNFGSTDAPNYILDAVTFNSITLTNTPFPLDGPFWSQFVSGGEAGYPTAGPVPFGEWNFGSGISRPFRELAPGSTDGFTFSEGDEPSIAPIPEPSTWLLIGIGSTVLLLLRRKSHA
jgi:hypothetical protein